MTETADQGFPTTPRVFWPNDYARLADALRRSRKGKAAAQLAVVDAVTAGVAEVLAQDFAKFDADKFQRAAKLRIETVHLDEYKAWAEKNGYSPEAIDAPACYTAFYENRTNPGSLASMELDDAEDDDFEDEDDDAEDDDPDNESLF